MFYNISYFLLICNKKVVVMLENYLPQNISKALDNIPYHALCELRLRSNDKVVVNLCGQNFYLSDDGFSENKDDGAEVTIGCLNSILNKISDNSRYTINDDIINGFVTLNGGIRLGVCGEVITVENKIKTIKNISSLNIRFPHFIKNCSLNIYPYIVKNGRVKSTLIVSPPGAGKTTFLRDLIYQITTKERLLNVLVVDERDEIVTIFNGNETERLLGIDVYSKCSKGYGFINGIRSMRPDVIVTDEINIEKDLDILELALTSGVSVLATIHAKSISDIKNKSSFKSIVNKGLFERYIVLSCENGVGTIEGVFDECFEFMGV